MCLKCGSVVRLSRIITEEMELKLFKDMIVNVNYEDDMWFLGYPELNIVSYGDTYDEALDDFQADFAELYQNFVFEDEKNMSKNSLKFKEYFKKLVGRINCFQTERETGKRHLL